MAARLARGVPASRLRFAQALRRSPLKTVRRTTLSL